MRMTRRREYSSVQTGAVQDQCLRRAYRRCVLCRRSSAALMPAAPSPPCETAAAPRERTPVRFRRPQPDAATWPRVRRRDTGSPATRRRNGVVGENCMTPAALGHAVERRRAAGQHVHDDEHQEGEQAELGHRARQRREEDAERGRPRTCRSAVQNMNSGIDPAIGTPSTPCTTKRNDMADTTTMTSAFDQTLPSMMSTGVSGITSRCSIVPCSRSRTSAAPDRMMASMVMLLMICDHRVEPGRHQVGIELARVTTSRTAGGVLGAARLRNVCTSCAMMLCDIAGAAPGLAHRRGIHVELDRRCAAGHHVGLEARRNVDHEGVAAGVHGGVDLVRPIRCPGGRK